MSLVYIPNGHGLQMCVYYIKLPISSYIAMQRHNFTCIPCHHKVKFEPVQEIFDILYS